MNVAPEHLTRWEEDPLERVMALGDRAVRVGMIVGLVLALVGHTAASAKAWTTLFDMQRVVERTRSSLHEYFWAIYDVDTAPKKVETKDEPPPPPPPEPVAPPEMKAPAPKLNQDPYETKDTSPPKPSEAAKVITADKPTDEPEDMTRFGIVSGNGTALGGQQSGQGEGNQVVKSPSATLKGVVGGTGTATAAVPPPPPPPTGPDRSAPAGIVGASSWSNCPFPPEADADQIDQAVVQLVVTVRPDGSAAAVKVVSDPGHGFGKSARQCALSRRYTAALDRDGNATTGTTPPIKVRFTR